MKRKTSQRIDKVRETLCVPITGSHALSQASVSIVMAASSKTDQEADEQVIKAIAYLVHYLELDE